MPSPLDERGAFEVIAVRAIERADRGNLVWTEEDRASASVAAAAAVGEGAGAESFLAARAALLLGRVRARSATLMRGMTALRWRGGIALVVVAAGFLAGAMVDEIGGAHRINLLALPLFGVLAWNVAVYAVIVTRRMRRGRVAAAGPVRAVIARLAGSSWALGRARSPLLAAVAADWLRFASALYAVRSARLLHFGAVAFAAGLVTGLYVRGLAFEYRATWESTFLDAAAVRALVAFVLSPGALLTHLAIPSVADIAAIRAPASENAGRWLHLMAATVMAVVIVPRLALGCGAAFMERRMLGRLRLPLDDPYFARLLRDFRGHAARVVVAPYSYSMRSEAATGLERLLRGVFGARTVAAVLPSVPYGDEERDFPPLSEQADAVIVLFSGAATPEREAHGAFVRRLCQRASRRDVVVALVDEGPLHDRWPDAGARWSERRASWLALCADQHVACVFARLASGDAASAAPDFERAFHAAMP